VVGLMVAGWGVRVLALTPQQNPPSSPQLKTAKSLISHNKSLVGGLGGPKTGSGGKMVMQGGRKKGIRTHEYKTIKKVEPETVSPQPPN